VISGTAIADLSLDPAASPNVASIADWKIGCVNGRGRVVNGWFHVCGGGNFGQVPILPKGYTYLQLQIFVLTYICNLYI
jgi:hypothetical protein